MAGQAGRPAYVVASYAGQAESCAGDASGAGRGARLRNGVVCSIVVISTLRRASRHAESSVMYAAVASGAGGCVGAGEAVVEALLAGHGGEISVPPDRALIVA